MRWAMAQIGTQDQRFAPSREESSQRVHSVAVPALVIFAIAVLGSFLAVGTGMADPANSSTNNFTSNSTNNTAQGISEKAHVPATTAWSPEIPGVATLTSIADPDTFPQSTNVAYPALVGLMTEVGRSWTYMVVSERTRNVEGGELESEKVRGTRIDEITGLAPELGAGVVRMLSTSRQRSSKSPNELSETHTGYYRAAGSSFQLVAEQAPNSNSEIGAVMQYDVPLHVLEAAAQPGQRWSIGVRSQQDLHTNLEGEVLGVQDVETPQGPFKGCLVIRLKGQISGVIEAYGSRMEVPSGDYSVTQWYAPGVGLVLAKEEISQTLILEDGRSMNYSERTQFALRSSESAAAAAPAPGR